MVLDERDRQLLASLNAPAPAGARFGVTQYLFEIYRARPDLLDAFPDLDRDGEAFIEWVHAHGREEIPIIDELLPPAPAEFRHFTPTKANRHGASPRWGVNVVGFLRAELGMGEAARLIISGLDACGVPLLPVEGAVRPVCRHAHEYETVPATAAGFPISILSTNPLGVIDLRREVGREFFSDRYSIGYWWWETHGHLPFEWRADFDLLDEVWVASQFAADCLQPQLPMSVVPMKLPIEVSEVPMLSRAELGLPEGFLFLFVFDYASTLKRKNPVAVIEAFRRAFTPGEGAALVIKCMNPTHDPEGHMRLKALVAEHPDIRLIGQYVSAPEKNAMIAACDCYVSLHRAEGFGLTTAEAMYLGKPVIATGYSGNLDYMTEANSHLVRYTMTEVGTGAWPYPRDGVWAEPDVDHAAELMRRVYEDREAGRALGIRASRDIRRTHSPAAAGEMMKRRLSEIALRLLEHDQPRSDQAFHRTQAAELLARGEVPQRRSGLRPVLAPARRLLQRALAPYTASQRQIDERLTAALADVKQQRSDSLRALERVRELELNLALTRATELREARTSAAARRRVDPASSILVSPQSNGLASGVFMRSNDGKRTVAQTDDVLELQTRVASVKHWWHTIDLGDGVVTPGRKGDMTVELLGLRLPDMRGKSVLDIGARDGYYSFEAEQRGARRVVALDHYAWAIDWEAKALLSDRELADIESSAAWRPDELPGKKGFDLAREALESRVEPLAVDFMTAELEELGTFDVVLCLGVLHRMRDPFGALRRLALVTAEMAIIESAAILLPGQEDRVLCEFSSDDQANRESTNSWAPSLIAIHGLLKAAGFAESETVKGPPAQLARESAPLGYRAVVHAFKKRRATSIPPVSGAVSVQTDVGELWYPGHRGVLRPGVQQHGVWDPQDAAAITAALCPGMTVIDIGARVGYLTILAAQWIGPTGRVLAVEPAPENFKLLEANVTRRGARNVSLTQAAAWCQRGELELWLSQTNSGDDRGFEHEGAGEVVRVAAVPVDDLLGDYAHVDLVLLDTHGSERTAIEGMTHTIARFRPQLQAKFWPDAVRSVGDDPTELVVFYRELGYHVSVLGAKESMDIDAAAMVELAERIPGRSCTLILTPLR
jgi:FkbM family methyltransferase